LVHNRSRPPGARGKTEKIYFLMFLCICRASSTKNWYDPNVMCQVMYVRYVLFNCCPGNVDMYLSYEWHGELARVNVILSGHARKKYLFNCCPGNVGMYLLCEKH